MLDAISFPTSLSPVYEDIAPLPDLRPTTSSTIADLDTDADRDWSIFLAMPVTPPSTHTDAVAGISAFDLNNDSNSHFVSSLSAPNVYKTPWKSHSDHNHNHSFNHNHNTSSHSSSSSINKLDHLFQKMPAGAIASSNSSPVDFAFEAPVNDKSQYNFTPQSQYPPPYGGYSTGSSFSSSASGSVGGTSFSSIDALPAISRDFVRPSLVETRRPVTAGGALQGRSPLANVFAQRKDTIEEEMFTNPFSTGDRQPRHSDGVDPRYVPQQNRRASEGQFNMPPPSWPPQPQDPTATTPQYQYYQNNTPFRSSQLVNRPQTSDGLPSFGGQQALPSARSVVGSVDGFTPLSQLAPAAHIRSSYDESMNMPYRDRPSSSSALDSRYGHKMDSDIQFVPIGGPAPKKRPRRRYDEIERLYLCGWNGCEKSYGTLNHLNAHVAMQKHGEKRLPSEFKDMRKAWRKRKREQAAAAANGVSGSQYGSWGRGSISSGSEYDRRESTMTSYSNGSRYPEDGSGYSYDSRPNTASSVGSSVDSRPFAAASGSGLGGVGQYAYTGYTMAPQQLQQGQGQMGAPSHSHPAHVARRDSAPQHIPIPQQMGFRVGDDGPTPTQQNPFPIANANANQAAAQPKPASGGFPFQALTQPMPMGGSQYSQFAFQR